MKNKMDDEQIYIMKALLDNAKQEAFEEQLYLFAVESNKIEGIDDIYEHDDALQRLIKFLKHDKLTIENVCKFNTAGKLRDKVGMDVRIGDYRPPKGSEGIEFSLECILENIHNFDDGCPHRMHILFEELHPFMDGNGRTGRAIWLWQMVNQKGYDISLGFLHKFYYQTLADSR